MGTCKVEIITPLGKIVKTCFLSFFNSFKYTSCIYLFVITKRRVPMIGIIDATIYNKDGEDFGTKVDTMEEMTLILLRMKG